MATTVYRMYGNLALAPEIQPPASRELPCPAAPRPVAVPPRQVLPADAAPRLAAPAASRASWVRMGIACVLLGIVVAGAAIGVAARSRLAWQAAQALPRTEVVVTAGSSLWSLASAHPAPGLDTAATSDLIGAWNHVDAGTLKPGQVLLVPAS